MSHTALFVYGTLMRGQRAHDLLAPWVVDSRPALLPDHRLYECGEYPTVWPAEGRRVRGELVTLRDADEALAQLDDYEDCPGEFERRRVLVHDEGGRAEEAWVYVLEEPPRGAWRPMSGERWEPVSSGEGSTPGER